MKGRGRVGTLAPDLADVVREYATVLTRYGCQDVVGDRYAGQWVRQAFREAGIRYRDVDRDRSGYYLEVEPLFSQGRIDLLDHLPLAREWRALERRPRAGGTDRVDHPRGGHDDHANAVAIAATVADMRAVPFEIWGGADGGAAADAAASLRARVMHRGSYFPGDGL